MMYKIEISELLEPVDQEKYPRERKVYEQTIPNLDVEAAVIYINTHNSNSLE